MGRVKVAVRGAAVELEVVPRARGYDDVVHLVGVRVRVGVGVGVGLGLGLGLAEDQECSRLK